MTGRCLRLVLIALYLLAASTAQAQDTVQPAQTFTLAQALQYSIDHYPSVRAALEQVNASAANVSVARSAYLPRLDALWQTNRATANNVFGQLLPQSVIPALSGPVLSSASSDSVWGTAAGGLLSWEPFDFGLRGATVREAEAGVVRARAQETLTRLQVQNAVASAFLSVINAEQVAVAIEGDAARRRTLARSAQALADNDLRPGAEASRASAELAAADTRVIQARQTLAIAQARLAQLLGSDGLVAASSSGLLDTVTSDAAPPTPATMHPLLQAGQAAIELARAREAVLDSVYRPRVYLQSSLFARGSGANPDGTFDGGADGLGPERANWAAGVQIVFPNLFDFSSLKARRAAADAITRAEDAHYDEAALTVSAERRIADATVASARAIAQSTPVQLAAARQSEAQARARYDAGLASIVEVAEAPNLLTQAEYQDAAARVDIWRALLLQAVAAGNLEPFIERLRVSGVK
jgi:outer membrane protein TolC